MLDPAFWPIVNCDNHTCEGNGNNKILLYQHSSV